jgi:hypothetical protein
VEDNACHPYLFQQRLLFGQRLQHQADMLMLKSLQKVTPLPALVQG